MHDSYSIGATLLLISVICLAAVLSNRITAWARVPAPLLLLVAAAAAAKAIPAVHAPRSHVVHQLVTVALVVILFDGGMHIGWRRFRRAAGPIAVVGILGTFLTAGGLAVFLQLAVGLGWYPALLVATAIAPTDPALVFSVLGQREVEGGSGTLLEGESGANDPVGIALMASLLAAGSLTARAFTHVAGEFVLQMAVGALVGAVGGLGLSWFMRRVALPGEGLYPVRTVASAFAVFGLATVAHGSGFLAVFVAGIVIGDLRAPYKREIEHVHSALASLGEITAFVVLGLTVDLGTLTRLEVWLPGLLTAVVLTFVVRPLLVGPLLARSGLRRREKAFVLYAGLKGAVPILLGSFLLDAPLASRDRLYGIVVVVVLFSVAVQGTSVPAVARRLRIPMRDVDPEPWALGVRLRAEPDGFHRLRVEPGSIADGRSIAELADVTADAWISVVVRAGALVQVSRDTVLEAGDEALVLGSAELTADLRAAFSAAPR